MMFVLILMLSAMLETASIQKRSYSDQSVRGYITEVLFLICSESRNVS